MLELTLVLQDQLVSVHVNRQKSHQFSFVELDQTKDEWKDFLDNPRPYGEKLFTVLFKNSALTEFNTLSKQTKRDIVLVLESPELDSVAWEYAYNKTKEEYIVEEYTFVRALPKAERPINGRLKDSYERIPLLFIPANPLLNLEYEPMISLDEETEWREVVKHITASNAGFDLLKMLPATSEKLQTVMAKFQEGLIVHFSGHGVATREGAILVFEKKNGASDPLDAKEFVRDVKDKTAIVFLSACQSAVANETKFSNIARELVRSGVPFALGMQFNLPDPFVPNISGQFYNYLSHGHTIPEAVRQARRAVKREHENFIGMIALYVAHPDESGKLYWNSTGTKTASLFSPADVSDLSSPTSGLIGRQRELIDIGKDLISSKRSLTVTLHGVGGIGKTALLWQSLLRFAPSYELTLAIALDPLPSLESVLERIELFLGLPSPCSNDGNKREKILRDKLRSKRTLLGLDNFETLNYALNEQGKDEHKIAKSLHAFFTSLAKYDKTSSDFNVILCVTSREFTNLPGESIKGIQGLTNENGGKLFQENVVRQKDKIFINNIRNNTHSVSEMVGGHPLALRLLASAFDDNVGMQLEEFVKNFQVFLTKARDKWTEESRHESLRASYDFTMINLMKTREGREFHNALSRLSVFSAYFNDLIAVPVLEFYTPKNNDDFERIRPQANKVFQSLWQRGLLDRIMEYYDEGHFYMYRVNPTLRPFIEPTPSLFEKSQGYFWNSLYTFVLGVNDKISKVPILAKIARRSLPDLLSAAKLESRVSREESAEMQYKVGIILRQLGSYQDALSILIKARETYITLRKNNEGSVVTHEIANIYSFQGEFELANKEYQSSLKIAESIGDFREQATTLHQLGMNHHIRGDIDNAQRLFERSIEMFETTNDVQGKSIALSGLAKTFVVQGKLDKAIKITEQALSILRKAGDQREEAITMSDLANIHVARGDLDKALKIYEQSLKMFERIEDSQSKAVTLGEMSKIYWRYGDLQKALQLQQEKIKIISELGDKHELAVTFSDFGNIYSALEDFDKAIKNYKKSLDISEEIKDLQGKSATLHQMANICYLKNDLESAMRFYSESLDLARKIGNLQGESIILGNMSKTHWIKKEYVDAIEKLWVGLQQLKKINAEPQIQKSMTSTFRKWRMELGTNKFDKLWKDVVALDIPDWII